MKFFGTAVCLLCLCGCTTKQGRVYPILGFGFVVVNTNQPSATMVKSTVLGAAITTIPPQAIVGFGQSRIILVTTNSNLILEQ